MKTRRTNRNKRADITFSEYFDPTYMVVVHLAQARIGDRTYNYSETWDKNDPGARGFKERAFGAYERAKEQPHSG